MIVYNIVTIVCLLLMGVGLASVIAKIALTYKNNKREERIEYVREYKKGRMVLIYIFVFPLLLAGFIYGGKPVFSAITSAVATVIDMVVLKFDPSNFEALMSDSLLYKVAIYISYILIVMNAGMFGWSIAGQYISNTAKNLAVKGAKDKVVIFGNNAHNETIYNSEKGRKKVIVDRINSDDAKSLYVKNVVYLNVANNDEYVQKLVASSVKRGEKLSVVINTDNDEKNIEIARNFVKSITALSNEERTSVFDLMRIFVFGNPRFETVYNGIVEDGFGCISYVNKYQKMAVDFIDKYPFTRFMDANHIDYTTCCVKNGVDINAIMIGFGKTNQQLFLTSVANNQFIEKVDGKVRLKKVNYHIFDKSFKDKNGECSGCHANDKNLNHNYFRYKNECADINAKDYLELPDYPAQEFFNHLDVNDQDFYNEIRNVLTKSKNDVNFVVIAFGNDLENIDMAEKINTKINEWGVTNATVFVKVRSDHKGQFENKAYYPICLEDDVVYNIENIEGDKIFKMSMLRDKVYALEYEVSNAKGKLTEEDVERVKKQAHYSWFADKTPAERESNIYCTLSLRSKLNMMGFDYCKVDEDGLEVDEKTYLGEYAGEDMPDTTAYDFTADGKAIVKYTLDFKKSRRGDMAIHEHYRWNSFMITKGFIPATKDAICNEKVKKSDGGEKFTNGKNYKLRRHGNLTTFEGLVEFRKMVAERDRNANETIEKAEERKDVIKYDYQLLDDAHWLLSKTGHKIVRRVK